MAEQQQQQQQSKGPDSEAAPVEVTVSSASLQDSDVAFGHLSSHLLLVPTRGNDHDRFRDMYSEFLCTRQRTPEGRTAALWVFMEEEFFSVNGVVAATGGGGGAGTATSTASSSANAPSSTSSGPVFPRDAAEAIAKFVWGKVRYEDRGRFLEPTTPHVTSILRVITNDQGVPRLADLFQRRLKPLAPATTATTATNTNVKQQMKAAPKNNAPPSRPKSGPSTSLALPQKPSPTTAASSTTTLAQSRGTGKNPLPPPPPQPGVKDLASGIPTDASSVAYVHDRAINVDAHSTWKTTSSESAMATAATDVRTSGGGGNSNDPSHNMYGLLRSWVQDDPYRKVVEGDLLDYETVDVPVYQSIQISAPPTTNDDDRSSGRSVWTRIEEAQKRPGSRKLDLPDLSRLTEERTRSYRQQRKAHKRALRAKDQHVLEAMRKRGIHVEPRRR